MAVKIATWNVNSVRLRLPHLLQWMDKEQPDIVCLQEIKCVNDDFPKLELEQRGYQCFIKGQKGFNGVAVLSKIPVELVTDSLRGDDDGAQSRYMEIQCGDFRVINIYAPNGNPVDSDKYPYKLNWTDRLIEHAELLLEREIPFLICGDYNIIPEEMDCYDPVVWREDALFRWDTRFRWRALLNLGLEDAFRIHNKQREQYSFWDYQAGSWQRNLGIRIDHFLLSPHLTDRLQSCAIDKSTRDLEKPSDHVPVYVEVR